MQLLLGIVLVAHGVITAGIGVSAVSNPSASAVTLPSLFAWWPGPFGRSWLFDAISLGSGAATVGGLIWLVSGLALIAGGLGWSGVPILEDSRVFLLVGGALVGLLALVLYFHPIYFAAVVINLALVVLLWSRVSGANLAS
jgi:hypothetical protein